MASSACSPVSFNSILLCPVLSSPVLSWPVMSKVGQASRVWVGTRQSKAKQRPGKMR